MKEEMLLSICRSCGERGPSQLTLPWFHCSCSYVTVYSSCAALCPAGTMHVLCIAPLHSPPIPHPPYNSSVPFSFLTQPTATLPHRNYVTA